MPRRESTAEADAREWEEVADQLAGAFAFMRKQNGAAMFPMAPGLAWYDAIVAYEHKKFPQISQAVDDRYPGR